MKEKILVLPPSEVSSGNALLTGIVRYAKQRGWKLRFFSARRERDIAEAISLVRPVGCIVGGRLECSGKLKYIPQKAFGKIPTVWLDWTPHGPNARKYASAHDSTETGRLAAKELADLRLRSYGYVPASNDASWDTERRQGFIKELRRLGYKASSFNLQGNSEPAHLIKLRDWLHRLPKPAGIFAATDLVARDILNTAEDAGIDVPGDIAIIGVDNNTSICESTDPGITSIEPDFEQGGFLACSLLDDLIANPKLPAETRWFRPRTIIRRGSTARITGKDTSMQKALQLIRERACHGLYASEVALSIGGSRRYAERRFKATFNQTILDAINDVRLERAKSLLATPSVKLQDIATLCGWTNANFLRRLFRAKTGLTMSDWRRKNAYSATIS